MSETAAVVETKKKGKSNLKNGLLIVQILLPFGAYLALQAGNRLWAGVIAGAFVLSMAVLVWAG
jgi:uncharacterized MnhB-related membrane protein